MKNRQKRGENRSYFHDQSSKVDSNRQRDESVNDSCLNSKDIEYGLPNVQS